MYISAKEAAKKWGISERRVRILCAEGRVDGVLRSSWAWNIPSDAPKPGDGRQLRHMKNLDLRIGMMDFSKLEQARSALQSQDDRDQFLRSYKHLVTRFVLASFAAEDLEMDPQDLAVLFSQCFVPSLQFDTQVLALNMRTIMMRMLHQYGLGPVKGKSRPQMSEQRLLQLYQMLIQGLDSEGEVSYRTDSVIDQNRSVTVLQQMETLFVQWDRDWTELHPVVRAIFLYGELIRIKPFGMYDGLLASLAFAQELLNGGFPPALVEEEHEDEFKAAMILTRSRGNYQNVLRMIEQVVLRECKSLQGEA
ncbi:MAG: hypothetical protein PHP67_04025 [Sphaerochaeta sp.]|nr:hypothetical protein [Sphaerochaeta sp.]MDD4647368.1 hypothetical protein [Sphaerochaeta sp.]